MPTFCESKIDFSKSTPNSVDNPGILYNFTLVLLNSYRNIYTGEPEWKFKTDSLISSYYISGPKMVCYISCDTGIYPARHYHTIVLEIANGRKLAELEGKAAVNKQFATVIDNKDHTINIYDAKLKWGPTVIYGKRPKHEDIFFIGNNLLFTGDKLVNVRSGKTRPFIFTGAIRATDDSSRVLLMSTGDQKTTLYNLKTAEKIASIDGDFLEMDNERTLITSRNKDGITGSFIWNYITGKPLQQIDGAYEDVLFDKDKRDKYAYVFFTQPDSSLASFNCLTNKLTFYKGNLERVSSNEEMVLTKNGNVNYIYQLDNGKPIKEGPNLLHDPIFESYKNEKSPGEKELSRIFGNLKTECFNCTMFSADKKFALALLPGDSAIVKSVDGSFLSKKIKLSLPSKDDWIFDMNPLKFFTVSGNKEMFFTSDEVDQYIYQLDDKKREIKLETPLFEERVTEGKFSQNRKFLFTKSYTYSPEGPAFGLASVWDVTSGKRIIGISGAYNSRLLAFNADSSLLAGYNNGTVQIYDAEKGNLLYEYLDVDSLNYLVTDQYGRYDGTETTRKSLYYVCGNEVIGLDQVKDQLWVPNLAERIMKGDSINAKKLSDLDICGLIPHVEKEDKSGYHFIITPQRGGLGETVVYVNGIEEKRYKPKQLTKTATRYKLDLDEKELVPYFISGQQNSVTVKAYTANNDISSRGAEIIKDETQKQRVAPNLYAVMIGVSDYKGPELQLKYAAKDAEDISAAISASAKKLLDTTGGKEHVFMYNLTTGKNRYVLPEKIAVKNIFGEIGKKATANDILLIFFAGHGVTSGEKKTFYFLTADASRSSATDAPAEVGISTKELSAWMQPSNIKAQKRILILDACNSGQAINELVKVGSDGQNYLAARNDDRAEQIKAIDKLNEKSGLFILAASASNQSAYEMGRYSQGLLTYSLLKAIKQQPDILEDNKYLNVSRWFNAAEKTVSDMVRETGNRQEPQIVSAGNFNIGVVDQEVMAGIKLADEKPLFTASKFLDVAIEDDDLDLSSLIDQSMNEISSRGGDSQISYVTASASPDAWSLSGGYDIKGDEISVKVNIKQNKEIKTKLELTGTKSELKALAEKVVNEAADWILKKK